MRAQNSLFCFCFFCTIRTVQNKVSNERREANRKLCSDKCKNGPVVHNFTTKKIPNELLNHLVSGLNNVPNLRTDYSNLKLEIEQESVQACKNAFVSMLGFYPRISSISSLNQTIIQLLSQAPANSEYVNRLVSFREHYVDGLHKYFDSIDCSGINLEQILKLIPKDCIISQSDKNIGVSLLPPAWYAKEYHTQIEKGGHEKVEMSENQCIATLNKIINDFKENCTKNQAKILKKFWPRQKPTTYRIGVLKLVPKVISK